MEISDFWDEYYSNQKVFIQIFSVFYIFKSWIFLGGRGQNLNFYKISTPEIPANILEMIIHPLSKTYGNFRLLRWILFKSEGFYTNILSFLHFQKLNISGGKGKNLNFYKISTPEIPANILEMIIHVLSKTYWNFRSLRWILFKSEGFYTNIISFLHFQKLNISGGQGKNLNFYKISTPEIPANILEMIIHPLSKTYWNFRLLRWILFKSEGFYTNIISFLHFQKLNISAFVLWEGEKFEFLQNFNTWDPTKYFRNDYTCPLYKIFKFQISEMNIIQIRRFLYKYYQFYTHFTRNRTQTQFLSNSPLNPMLKKRPRFDQLTKRCIARNIARYIYF